VPLKQKCIPKAGTRRIVKTISRILISVKKMTARKPIKGVRQGIVEPAFGSLI
jgi:hypothetical protein